MLAWWPLGLYRVRGESMLPSLRPGDIVLGLRWFRPAPGDIVVARRPDGLIVKRLQGREGQGWILQGDNAVLSEDSRAYGPVSRRDIRAKVVRKLPR